MTELERFSPHDRVLVAAPHPDDESLATGGVLQAARAAGASCRVLIVTDGDNNPWPQRWIEKRWRIGDAERSRWGALRRSEAQSALRVLGVGAEDVRCLGLPDLGLTDVLMRGEPDLAALMHEELRTFAPTRLFLPSLADRHPDHSAVHVSIQLALARMPGAVPELLAFGVHGAPGAAAAVELTLSAAARATKAAAIRCHATQMRLSARRFIAYARTQEPFREARFPGRPEPDHALQARGGGDGSLTVDIDRARSGRLGGQTLFVVAACDDGPPLRRTVDFSGERRNLLVDTVAGRSGDRVTIEPAGGRVRVGVPLGRGVRATWIKLARRLPGLFVLDREGWQVAVPA